MHILRILRFTVARMKALLAVCVTLKKIKMLVKNKSNTTVAVIGETVDVTELQGNCTGPADTVKNAKYATIFSNQSFLPIGRQTSLDE